MTLLARIKALLHPPHKVTWEDHEILVARQRLREFNKRSQASRLGHMRRKG